MAFQKRKETIEKQIKEHQLARQAAKQNKCPINHLKTEAKDLKTENQEKIEDCAPKESSSNTSQTSANSAINPNKKFVVSIQTNEEKQKEMNLSKRAKIIRSISFKTKLMQFYLYLFFLDPEQVNAYCKKLFEFEVVKVKKFK